jgi:hypothetical protein
MDIKDRIGHQFPEFIANEYPSFIRFVEHYYNFLDSSELVLSGITGTFVQSEGLLCASTTKTSEIRSVDTDNSRLFIKTQNRFEPGDVVSGLISGATGTIVSLTPNPIQSIEELLDYRDIDATVSKYFTNFKAEFMTTIPSKLASGIDKRAITKGIVDLYRAKGTSEGHKLFFKMLLDEDVDIYYPSEDLLSPSDGDWSFDTIMRVDKGSIADINVLVGQEILQKNNPQTATNKATCKIDSVKTFFNGIKEILEFSINKDSIRGTFVPSEFVYITGTDSTEYIYTTAPLVSNISITDPGEYYSEIESVNISGFDYPANSIIETISSGHLTGIDIISGGSGYTGSEALVFDETNTLGQGTDGIVSGVHGGINLEDSGELVQEDFNVWESGVPENKLLLSSGSGDVVDTHLTRFGFNYDRIPSISASTSGTSAVFVPQTKNVGGISSVRVIDPGFNLVSSSVATPHTTLLITGVTGNYITNETVTSTSGGSGDVVTFESDISVLKLKNVSGTFLVSDGVTGGTTNVTSSILRNTTATLAVETGVLSSGSGRFISEDGFVSSFAKRIQDNYYYQKFSYLVKAAESIVTWRSAVKKAVHPAGFAVFGEINIVSLLDGKMKIPTMDTTTFTPELFSTFKDIIWTVLRRRLGSDGYGTKNPNPQVGGEGARDLSLDGHFDVGMTHEYLVNWIKPWENYTHYSGERGGQTLYNLNKYKFIDPPTAAGGAVNYDYLLVTAGVVDSYDYLSITDASITQQYDYDTVAGFVSDPTTLTHDYPGIHRPSATGVGTSNWLHPDTFQEGVAGGYTIDQWGHFNISDIDTGKNTRHNIPPPSEITLKSGVWIVYSEPPEISSDIVYYELPVSGTYTSREYTSTGTSDTYTVTPSLNYVVHIDGVILSSLEYGVVGSVLSVLLGVPSGSVVSIREFSSSINQRIYSGVLGTTYPITSGLGINNVLVYINNVIQVPSTNFGIVGSNVIMTSTLSISDGVIILEFSDTFARTAQIGDSSTSVFPVSVSDSTQESVITYVNGVFQLPSTNYTIN